MFFLTNIYIFIIKYYLKFIYEIIFFPPIFINFGKNDKNLDIL